jgi:hypothetical protein
MGFSKLFAVGLLGFGLCLTPVVAQETRGIISGRVTDTTGAVVTGAKVNATNTQTNTTVEATSSGEGAYTVTVEAQGFKKLIRSGIELRVADRINVDLQLEVGGITETVSVTAEAPLLEVSTATTGQVIDRRRIAELPLAEGNPMTLIQLAPGIVITGGFTSNSALSNSGPSNFARVGLQPPTDAVEEFKVVTASFDAQQGRTAGGSVDVAVRSGTNELHGTLYEFVRNDALAANSFFFNREGRERQTRRYNRFGGTVGGPVIIPKIYNGRDKTFFFTSYEGIRPITPSLETLTVPTEDFRRGDFSSLLNRATPLYVYDPLTARVEGDRVVRDPIQCNGRINVICPERISPIARNYLSFMPLPNTNLGSSTNNFTGNAAPRNIYNVFLARGDHHINERNRLFFRYSQSQRRELDENSAGVNNGVRINGRIGHRGNKGGVFDYVYVPSATTILNVRAGMTRFKQDRIAMADVDYDIRQMGFSESALRLFTANTLPQINIGNYSSPVEPTGYLITTPTSFRPHRVRLPRVSGKSP